MICLNYITLIDYIFVKWRHVQLSDVSNFVIQDFFLRWLQPERNEHSLCSILFCYWTIILHLYKVILVNIIVLLWLCA